MNKQKAAAHYAGLLAQFANPAMRTFYRGEKSFSASLDGIEFAVHGWIEPASGGTHEPYEPATVSINSICWPGSDLCLYQMLSASTIRSIQESVDEQAEERGRN